MVVHLLDEELTYKSSSVCGYCLHAGYIKCLYRQSSQSDLPVCEDDMALQDLLDFDTTPGSVHNGGRYARKDFDVASEDSYTMRADACSSQFYGDPVDITGYTLYGQSIIK
jgi:hypothetical protein